LAIKAPFAGDPAELAKLQHRYSSIEWMENGMGVLSEYERARRWTRTFLLDGTESRELFSRSTGDRYRNPGSFVHSGRSFDAGATAARGAERAERGAILVHNGAAFLLGEGASP